jgi:indole-3-glycerol phosphate synthase
MSVLDEILVAKRAEVRAFAGQRLPPPPARRPLALRRGVGEPLRLIAEIKHRSPSAGALSTRLSVGERARAYERAGASMLSVLTDARFFDGAFEHLSEARAASGLAILCKDFVIDETQLDRARAFGADAALLIVRCVAPERLAELVQAARARELEPLVEVASEDEARVALDAGADRVGVNARDLATLGIDPDRAERVLGALPAGVVRVHLSGLASAEDIARVARGSADAALVGEALMRQDDPEPLLARMRDRAGG